MKKISVLILAVIASVSASAARVSMITPAAEGASSYMFNGQSHNVFKNFVKDEVFEEYSESLGLVSPEDNNGGEELIYLGAYKNSEFNSSGGVINEIQVDVNNLNPDNPNGIAGATGDVSLVLSAGASLAWDISVDDNVELNSIFIFSISDQSLTINNQSVDLSSGDLIFEGINIETSPVAICGYALPDDGEGCSTDRILGFNRELLDADGMTYETNALFVNYLDDLTDLSVTSFSGSYIVDAFEIGIDSQAAVVPLPGTLVLYATALAALMIQRKPYKA
ncbi:hypothetical protein N9F42_01225 [Pseudomonadales bacterium]|nr:hypothetical protein [Pseudomonadales bacterium]